jgi:hypothetical protein
MYTPHTAPHATSAIQIGRKIGPIVLGALVAIAVVAVFALAGTRTTSSTPQVVTNNDTSASYAPPHNYLGLARPTSVPAPGRLTRNNQNSSAYTKAELYKPAR